MIIQSHIFEINLGIFLFVCFKIQVIPRCQALEIHHSILTAKLIIS